MNLLILTGYIATDIENRITTNGKHVCNFNVSVKRKYKGSDGEKVTDYFRCTAWSGTADFIEKYMKKGDRVLVSGELHNNVYEKDGVRKYSVDVAINTIEGLAPPSSKPTRSEDQAPYMTGFQDIPSESLTDEDLPF